MSRVAVVLFNIGGPDSPDSTRPFLLNLFSDPAILQMPWPTRWFAARLLAKCRASATRALYKKIGGFSPLLFETDAQARALEKAIQDSSLEVRAFPAMRYWHPFIKETAKAVEQWHPDHIVLLPLYPQFSHTTTGSSLKEWKRVSGKLERVTTAVCCWPTEPGFVAALAELTKQGVEKACSTTCFTSTDSQKDRQLPPLPRVLFSAHGLPKAVIARGDPYQYQVQQTVAAVVTNLQEHPIDYQICYQSRIGPQQWIGPDIGDAIRHAGALKIPVVIVPVTFVSEHVETLVELDIKYRNMARAVGVPLYIRVPTVGTHVWFVAGLARLVQGVLLRENYRRDSRVIYNKTLI